METEDDGRPKVVTPLDEVLELLLRLKKPGWIARVQHEDENFRFRHVL